MPFTFEGTLKLVSKGRPFTNQETGETTPAKFTNFFAIQDDEGEPKVLELKSKQDFTEHIDKLVVGTIMLYPMREGSGFWASVTDINPAEIK